MMPTLTHHGQLVSHCSSPGERRSDGVAPAHPNALQLSQHRWLLLISTLAFRGIDDARSIVYQLREGGLDGPILKEGVLAASTDSWTAMGDDRQYTRQFGHPLAFGVPKDALINGQRPAHHNHFVIKWRVCARIRHPEGYMVWNSHPAELVRASQRIEWMQVRLNEAEDDIEIIQPPRMVRQVGYEEGEPFCAADVTHLNQGYVMPVPLNDDGSEWVDMVHHSGFDNDRNSTSWVAPARYRYNPSVGLYEWIQTGAPLGEHVFEGSVTRWRDEWIVAARPRSRGRITWARMTHPFGEMLECVELEQPLCSTPLSIYACPDGALRMIGNDRDASPYENEGRNPLYLWNVDPDACFACADRQVIFDTHSAELPITFGPIVDMGKLVGHGGGQRQWILHRVRSCTFFSNDPSYGPLMPMTDGDFNATAIYGAQLQYDTEHPGLWTFADRPLAAESL